MPRNGFEDRETHRDPSAPIALTLCVALYKNVTAVETYRDASNGGGTGVGELAMFVAVTRVELHIPAASLKEKRAVVQSAIARIRNQFRVAIAEVDFQEQRNMAALGMATVSSDAGRAREVLEDAVRFLERTRLDADIGVVEFDVVAAF